MAPAGRRGGPWRLCPGGRTAAQEPVHREPRREAVAAGAGPAAADAGRAQGRADSCRRDPAAPRALPAGRSRGTAASRRHAGAGLGRAREPVGGCHLSAGGPVRGAGRLRPREPRHARGSAGIGALRRHRGAAAEAGRPGDHRPGAAGLSRRAAAASGLHRGGPPGAPAASTRARAAPGGPARAPAGGDPRFRGAAARGFRLAGCRAAPHRLASGHLDPGAVPRAGVCVGAAREDPRGTRQRPAESAAARRGRHALGRALPGAGRARGHRARRASGWPNCCARPRRAAARRRTAAPTDMPCCAEGTARAIVRNGMQQGGIGS